jgi:hypothetical protein
VALTLFVAGAAGLAFTLARRGGSEGATGNQTRTSQGLVIEAAVRAQAVAWIVHQVSRAALVSCDARVCEDLTRDGFPSANLVPLGSSSNDPLGSDLVVATADIRAQFGIRLTSVYAPAVLASFGSGVFRIDIRLVPAGGAQKYRAALFPALQARKAVDAQLLTNSDLTISSTAQAQLLSGEVDPRLPPLIVLMAAGHPLHIVDFLSQSPGGGPASLLRWVDFATSVPAAHLAPSAYARWMLAFIDAQRAEFRPAWTEQFTLPDGQAVLRIGYGAPSPLG